MSKKHDSKPSETPGASSIPEDRPGAYPVGSVTLPTLSGDLLTVPEAVALAIDKWLGPKREVDAGRVYEDRVVVVSHPDAQKKSFFL